VASECALLPEIRLVIRMKTVLHLAKFDAELNTDVCDPYNNADLTLKLKLGFRQINPPAGAASSTYNDFGSATGTPRKIIKWTATEWAHWKTNFVASAERFWNGKFWLLNNIGAYPFKAGSQIYLPNMYCKFDLIGSDATSGTHHHTIDVVRLDPTENWFGSHSTLYDSKDTNSVQKGTDSKGKPIMQRAHVHEVGHLLGLGHVDIGKPHCPATGNTNASACYGVADADKNSVMGEGMQLRLSHAAPWLSAMKQFLKTAHASPLYTPPVLVRKVHAAHPFVAKRVRQYPRTPDEYENNKLIISKPVRIA
jgi:hypothetical protein